jgi:hypothetical protein
VRYWHSIAIPQGRFVGEPYSSWLKKLPQRAIACIANRPGATASAQDRKDWRFQRTYRNAAIVPAMIPP